LRTEETSFYSSFLNFVAAKAGHPEACMFLSHSDNMTWAPEVRLVENLDSPVSRV
jgi:hypothetical protein